jgi:hypothetical protein
MIGRILRLAEDIETWFDELREIRSEANSCVSHSTGAYFIPITDQAIA